LDHEPPLQSVEEFSQHTADRHFLHGVELLAQRPVERDETYWFTAHTEPEPVRSDLYFDMNARRFLADHPKCRIGLINGYGDRVDVDEYTMIWGINQ
jgi:hypothetical protein